MKKVLSMIVMVVLAGALVLSMTACGKAGTAVIPSEAFSEPDVDGMMEEAESAYAELESVFDEMIEEPTVEETK